MSFNIFNESLPRKSVSLKYASPFENPKLNERPELSLEYGMLKKVVNFDLVGKNSGWAYSSDILNFLPDFIFNILMEYILI